MKQLKVAPIVEGDGEVEAVRILLNRIREVYVPDAAIHVLRPIRQPRDRLLRNIEDALLKALRLAHGKLRQYAAPEAKELALILVDADEDCAAQLSRDVEQIVNSIGANLDVAWVFAVREYETWFAAGADSLGDVLRIRSPTDIPTDPEGQGCRKRWVEERFLGAKYSETVDQPKLTYRMDVRRCRERSPSFDKLCREIETRLL
jgi:hypothetical protein